MQIALYVGEYSAIFHGTVATMRHHNSYLDYGS